MRFTLDSLGCVLTTYPNTPWVKQGDKWVKEATKELILNRELFAILTMIELGAKA